MSRDNNRLLSQMRKNAHSNTKEIKPKRIIREHGAMRRMERWFTLSSAVLVFTLLLPGNISSFLKSTPDAISEIVKWLYAPESWMGVYSSHPQGYVDIPQDSFTQDAGLAFYFNQFAGNILIGGARGYLLCEAGHEMTNAMVFASIQAGGSSANLEIVDYMNGHKIVLATGVMSKSGVYLDVSLQPKSIRNPEKMLDQSMRLGLHIADNIDDELEDLRWYNYPCDDSRPTLPNTSGTRK